MVKSDKVASAVEQEHYPYHPGVVIHADLYVENATSVESDTDDPTHEAEDLPERSPIPISLAVVQTLSTTLSCVLLVDVSDGYRLPTLSPVTSTPLPLTSKAVLKLYDRRFSAGLREDYDAAIWTPQIERKHRKFMAIPEDVRFACSANDEDDSWRYCSSDEGSNSKSKRKKSTNMARKKQVSSERWSSGHREAYMEQVVQKLYRTEVAIYRELRKLQGQDVPFIYGTVYLREVGRRSLGKLEVRGVLMQYIDPSFSLRDIPERIPDQTQWQEVGEAAVKVVQIVGDYGILNDDVRLDNILVVPTSREEDGEQDDADSEDQPECSTQRFKTVMIDFGIARTQRKDETDDEFRRERRRCDEEGAVGYVLEKHLMKAKQSSDCPHFKYRPSHRLDRPWDNDEEDIW
ncbi:unnamed protein product [Cyclocybe aegerita]|uniref:Protein kinase domain-containing protein n=1 Tax=Cyclocybe aegerita TaxID=1973307 RepID=A0A8S0XUE5_CYCAE|nr:unnamed protein product [Cyclocybe aegerita]